MTDAEKKLRRNLRIKEIKGKDNKSIFYLQKRILGMWFTFDLRDSDLLDILFQDYFVRYGSLGDAREAMDKYVNYILKEDKITYHYVTE